MKIHCRFLSQQLIELSRQEISKDVKDLNSTISLYTLVNTHKNILYKKITQRTIIMVGPVHETNSKDFKDLEKSRIMFSDHISVEMEINRSTTEGVFLVLLLECWN